MKKTVLSALVVVSFAAHADELMTFNDIANNVAVGKQITFVINTKKCKAEMPVGNAVISITPNSVMVLDNNRITASEKHFTLDDPLARGIPLYDYGKFSIDADGSAFVKMTVMNATNYEKLSSFQINCELGIGFRVFS